MAHKFVHDRVFKIFYIFCLVSLWSMNACCQTQKNYLRRKKLLKTCVVPHSDGTSYLLPGCSGPGSNCSIESGQIISGNATVLELKCEDTFIFQQKFVDMAVCYDGKWYPKEHSCLKTCTGISLDTLDKNCSYNGKPVSCGNGVRVGTRAELACKRGFETNIEFHDNYCLKTGKWKHMMINCAPICGVVENDENERFKLSRDANETIINASHAPWNAGVYLLENGTYRLICGGTLISEIFIISAIKCVVDKRGFERPPSLFGVALGKTYSDWNDERDLAAQKFNVSEILSTKLFENFFSGNLETIIFARHIVVLRIIGMVNFNTFVLPICLDIERYNRLYSELIGTVVGWNIHRNTSVTLKKFRDKVEANAACQQKLKPHEKIDNPSKFCTERIEQLGGYYGAGLTFKDVNSQKYYVIGILTDHFAEVSVYLGFRDRTSDSIINAMKIFFYKAQDFKSIQ